MQVRTRFAPSPTGFLHVGGIRTALFAWLVARHNNGQFILRLEDTDKNREVEGSAEHLMKSLKALGINYDEGPDCGGPHAPYKQSERLDIYKKWAQKLIDSGRAYADPYSPEEVQAFREQAQKSKQPFLYRNHRPVDPPKWDGTQPLRLKSDPKSYTWNDAVMGELSTGPEVIDDIILIKSDGYPTYNFCHIVDDAEMEITHIIRGQEFLASVPNYLNIYEALELTPPIMATMPHILNEQGNKKLGKRDGAKDVLDYIKEGYLPEALRSFIATLGWNDGTEQEVFTTEELIEKFSLDRVGKSGAHFDEKRLNWVNGHFIREMPLDDLYNATMGHRQPATTKESRNFWPPEAAKFDESYKKQVLSIVQERLKYLAELPELTALFFEEPTPNLELITTNKQLKKLEPATLTELLTLSLEALEKSDFTPEDIQVRLNTLLQTTNYGPSTIFSIIRIATTWKAFSPQLNETLAVLGKETTIRRLTQSIDYLNN
ncbi:MAG TPA: glutamate--tRNA ligase [Candidatus Saccharibacteria bacterium]|nr:glutamate--tRNA ligase [Candidatus Saccharibacteria bacterium]